ncbi:hypothetical protein OF83DRAFT_1179287 [Amylostereum chailletii]|nr:hypothetical protein OF83DRAFT_1179287 [Amylostereum chailletii]
MVNVAPSPLPVVYHLGPTLGVTYIGIVLSAMLYSLTCVQTFLYFQSHSSNDRTFIKLIVLVMLVLDSAHQALLIHAGYYYLISKFAQPAVLQAAVWSLLASVFFNIIAGRIFETFFIWRLYRCKSYIFWLASYSLLMSWSSCRIQSVLITSDFGIELVAPIQALKNPQFSNVRSLGRTQDIGFAMSVVTDWTLFIVLFYYLWRSRTHFRRTDTMINRIIAYTVSTDGLTSITTLINLIVYVACPYQLYFAFFNFMITPFYCNSLLHRSTVVKSKDQCCQAPSGAVRDAAFGQSACVQSIPFSGIVWRVPSDSNTNDVDPVVIRVDIEQSRTTQDGDTANQPMKPESSG